MLGMSSSQERQGATSRTTHQSIQTRRTWGPLVSVHALLTQSFCHALSDVDFHTLAVLQPVPVPGLGCWTLALN